MPRLIHVNTSVPSLPNLIERKQAFIDMATSQSVTGARLRTPRAAAVAGVLFSLPLVTALVLARLSVPLDPLERGEWLKTDSTRVALALNLVLFAGIAPEPLEAARIDGRSSRQVFWWIVLPQLRPVIVSNSLFQAILAFQVFGPIYTMTDGGPGHATEILPIYIYKTAFGIGAMGRSAAAAVVLVAITMALAAAFLATGRQRT